MKTTDYIGMYQQGGPAQQDPKQKLVALVQAAMSGDQAATQQIQQIMQAAQQGDPKAQQLAQAIQQIAQAMEQQAQIAKEGAKLEYIHTLRCGGKTKKKEEGGLIDLEKCGGKTKKKVTKKATCGCKLKKVGGRIVEVDGCTELPIHQQGGYIVPKAQVGLAQGLKKDYLTQMTEAPLPGGATTHNYYNAQTGKMQTGKWDAAGKKWNYTDMNNTESAAFLADQKNFNVGFTYDPVKGTGTYDTKENALAGMGEAQTYNKSNTSRYGFTLTTDPRINRESEDYITEATTSGNTPEQTERIARKALRQDRRDLRAFARQYGKYYNDGNGNTGKKAMKEALGLGTGKTVKQMMNGKGSGWLGERASSVNSGIQTAGSYLASQSPANLNSLESTKVAATNEKSDKTPVSNVSKPVITTTKIGSGALSFKIGGLLKKFQFGVVDFAKCGKKLEKIVKYENPAKPIGFSWISGNLPGEYNYNNQKFKLDFDEGKTPYQSDFRLQGRHITKGSAINLDGTNQWITRLITFEPNQKPDTIYGVSYGLGTYPTPRNLEQGFEYVNGDSKGSYRKQFETVYSELAKTKKKK